VREVERRSSEAGDRRMENERVENERVENERMENEKPRSEDEERMRKRGWKA
jgi:hypothetical protein